MGMLLLIFVADAKIIYGYNFIASLTIASCFCVIMNDQKMQRYGMT